MPLTPDLKADLVRRIREQSSPLDPRPTGLIPSCPRIPRIRAILFDVYGTLMISAAGDVGTTITQSRNAHVEDALRAVGLTPVPGAGAAALRSYHESIRSEHDSRRKDSALQPEVNIVEIWRRVMNRLLQEGYASGPLPDESLYILAVEFELRQNPVWMMPGAVSVLRELRDRGLLLGLVSNAQFFTPLMIEALSGLSLDELGFAADLHLWSWEQGEAKPSPTLWQRATRRLSAHHGIPPSAVLAVGNDGANDIAAPASLGCHTALFAGDARSLRNTETQDGASAADVVLTDLRQLTGVLEPES